MDTWHTDSKALFPALLLALLLTLSNFAIGSEGVFSFDDSPLSDPLKHPHWFKESFLDLQEDLQQARDSGKQGLIVYFGQQRCPYCQKLLQTNFGQPDIANYTQLHFDVVAIDIWSVEEVTDIEGNLTTEREFAQTQKTTFTPSLIFYDPVGHEALRLTGYYPPYTFRAALEYVADGHYRNESFKTYMERGEGALAFAQDELNEEHFFSQPPHALDRSRFAAAQPLAVFFEQGDCHACDVLHSAPLQEETIQTLLQHFENVQLDIRSETPVITPKGRRTTSREWAAELELFYTPSIIFFDEQGREIIRVDSVVQFYRLRNVLNYIVSEAYRTEPSFQRWRAKSRF
jgi:thioredoxin-related protein